MRGAISVYLVAHREHRYSFKNPNSDPSKWLTGEQLAGVYNELVEKYDIVSIEDPFDQDDWEAWSHLTKSTKIQIVGG